LRDLLTTAAYAGIESAKPEKVLGSSIMLDDRELRIREAKYDLTTYNSVRLVALGKAACGMAGVVEDMLGHWIKDGIVITKEGHSVPLKISDIYEASHPLPDDRSVDAAKELKKFLQSGSRDDLVIVLISGGGSALLTSPAKGLSLVDIQTSTDLLLRSGAPIGHLNTVRKHISSVQGGRLAHASLGAQVLVLVISDVLQNHLDVIASGPFVGDPSSFSDAIRIIDEYGLRDEMPISVIDEIRRGQAGIVEETPEIGDPIFDRVRHFILADVATAANAVMMTGKQLGFAVDLVDLAVEGEARDVGRRIANRLIDGMRYRKAPFMDIYGGETTVTVQGNGKGGRNQELALSAALELDGIKNVAIASIGTDGTDGPTDAAGAIVDGGTVNRGLQAGLDARGYLKNNDSYSFLSVTNDLFMTGATLTNVNDLILASGDPVL